MIYGAEQTSLIQR